MHHRRRVAGAVLLALAVLNPMSFLSPRSVLAVGYTGCSDGPGAVNRWRGVTYSDAGSKHGAAAVFEGQTLQRCNTPGPIEIDGSFMFSNIVPAGGGFNDIIQTGIGNCRSPGQCSGGMHYYTGVGLSPSTPGCAGWQPRAPVLIEHGSQSAAPHTLKIYHVSNEWRFMVDTSIIRTFPESSLCWTGKTAVFFAETWDFGDQIGGQTTNKFRVDTTNYTNSEGGTFVLTPTIACGYGGSGAPFYCSKVSNTSFDTWTTDR
jgi:hypothetical protein